MLETVLIVLLFWVACHLVARIVRLIFPKR
jgi:hypothetical protein